MLKKLFKAVTTLTLLVGCYFGYVHVFAIVVEQFRAIRRTDSIMFAIHDSNSKLESIPTPRTRSGPITGAPPRIWPTAITTPSAATGSTPRSASGSSRKTACATTASGFD